MPLSLTWYTNNNVALADTSTALRHNASMWHNFLKMLCRITNGNNGVTGQPPVGSAWSVHSSCNGTTASAGNNFNNTFTASEWVRAAPGSAHSWFVLQSPATVLDGPWYITVSLGSNSGDTHALIKISKIAPSGGTTTADPTSATESAYTTTQMSPTTPGAGKSHLTIDADGNFKFWTSKNGSGYCHTFVMVRSLSGAVNDSYRAVLGAQFQDSGRGVPAMTTAFSIRGIHLDGTAANASDLNIGYIAVSSSTSIVQSITQLRAADSKADGVDFFAVFATKANNMGFRGKIVDVWLNSGGPAVGAGDPSGAAPTRVTLGGITVGMGVVPGL